MNIFMILTIIVGVLVYALHAVYYFSLAQESARTYANEMPDPELFLLASKIKHSFTCIFWPITATKIALFSIIADYRRNI